MNQEKVNKRVRVTGDARKSLLRQVSELYIRQKMSIREVSQEIGRSYGGVHRLLIEAGVSLRPRGNQIGKRPR